nr:TetR family transcriptional regulator [Arthrobacter sp. Hiyo1]
MSSTIQKRAARKTPAERAAEIAEAAKEIALEQGLSAITLRNVAARVGVASGLVAHYQQRGGLGGGDLLDHRGGGDRGGCRPSGGAADSLGTARHAP